MEINEKEGILLEHYPSWEKREALKKWVWPLIHKENNPSENARYIVNFVIYCHYWRAREHLENQPTKLLLRKAAGAHYYDGYQLDIDLYTKHWLHAMGYFFDSEVLNAIETEWGYKPQETKFLPEGNTMYRLPTVT